MHTTLNNVDGILNTPYFFHIANMIESGISVGHLLAYNFLGKHIWQEWGCETNTQAKHMYLNHVIDAKITKIRQKTNWFSPEVV